MRFGSASVPVYKASSEGRTRYCIAYYRDGKRLRQFFSTLQDAKREANLVAQRIQSGLQHVTDLKPHERDSYRTAEKLLEELDMPLVSAIEDYIRARKALGDRSLTELADHYARHFQTVKLGTKVSQVVEEMLESRRRDGVSKAYLGQLRTTLGRFAGEFTGDILGIRPANIDGWLRSMEIAPATRNSMLRCLKAFFAFARERDYLPEDRPTAAEGLKLLREQSETVSIFEPTELELLLKHAEVHLIPPLSIGAFAGIRTAELKRLSWDAVDLERGVIEIRRGQAKTGSRRLVPISSNLREWLAPFPRQGPIITSEQQLRDMTAHARDVGLSWPRNVLRHSFISYRLAKVKSVDEVALEAGNSPAIIFRHYRELVTEERAAEWFSIRPPEGWVHLQESSPWTA